ncbi:MAG: DUF3341 domain-containing protein [Armatimonadetes bacterium]|nr:DUF3341 domain-containing protein [Armatimonadota bacterium]
MAEFEHAEDVVAAARRVRDAGYKKIDAYTPFPVEGLSEALGFRDHWIPFLMLIGGIVGCIGGFALVYYCTVIAYPLNIGGRPLFSWPMYIPVTFECTVLVAALTGVLGMFLLNGLPMPYHPVFDHPDFDRASSDRFFLCIEARDPNFDFTETRRFMETLGALHVSDIELRK